MSVNWGNKRQQQHKEKSDDKKLKDDLEVLRGENSRLKKKIARLEKELGKKLHQLNNFSGKPEPAEVPKPMPEQLVCKKCGTQIKVIELGPKTLYVCENCGTRSLKGKTDEPRNQ